MCICVDLDSFFELFLSHPSPPVIAHVCKVLLGMMFISTNVSISFDTAVYSFLYLKTCSMKRGSWLYISTFLSVVMDVRRLLLPQPSNALIFSTLSSLHTLAYHLARSRRHSIPLKLVLSRISLLHGFFRLSLAVPFHS